MKTQELKSVLTFTETAKLLNVTKPTLRGFLKKNLIPFRKVERCYFFDREAVMRWVRGENR